MLPSDEVGLCLCGLNRGAHRPQEAYYGEERLEGRKSSSMAQAYGCSGYRESHLSLSEVMKLRYCGRRWLDVSG